LCWLPNGHLPDVGAFVLANNTPHIDQQLRFRRFGAIGHGHDRQRHISLFAFFAEQELVCQLA